MSIQMLNWRYIFEININSQIKHFHWSQYKCWIGDISSKWTFSMIIYICWEYVYLLKIYLLVKIEKHSSNRCFNLSKMRPENFKFSINFTVRAGESDTNFTMCLTNTRVFKDIFQKKFLIMQKYHLSSKYCIILNDYTYSQWTYAFSWRKNDLKFSGAS